MPSQQKFLSSLYLIFLYSEVDSWLLRSLLAQHRTILLLETRSQTYTLCLDLETGFSKFSLQASEWTNIFASFFILSPRLDVLVSEHYKYYDYVLGFTA